MRRGRLCPPSMPTQTSFGEKQGVPGKEGTAYLGQACSPLRTTIVFLVEAALVGFGTQGLFQNSVPQVLALTNGPEEITDFSNDHGITHSSKVTYSKTTNLYYVAIVTNVGSVEGNPVWGPVGRMVRGRGLPPAITGGIPMIYSGRRSGLCLTLTIALAVHPTSPFSTSGTLWFYGTGLRLQTA